MPFRGLFSNVSTDYDPGEIMFKIKIKGWTEIRLVGLPIYKVCRQHDTMWKYVERIPCWGSNIKRDRMTQVMLWTKSKFTGIQKVRGVLFIFCLKS